VFTDPQKFYNGCDGWFGDLSQKAKLDHYTPHDLRRTCNTLMQDESNPREAAMQVLGHSTPRVNQEYYTGMLKKQQRTAIDSLPSIG